MRECKIENALLRAEVESLYKIAEKSKMDCWFKLVGTIENVLDTSPTIYYRVYDKENKNYISLKKGVSLLCEGLTSYSDYSLVDEEITAFESLLKWLKIKTQEKWRC